MILHCNTLRHPLQHPGTQQQDRLPASLMPGELSLDERSMEQLIAFAGTLSTHIRYFNADNKASGDWLSFWQSDLTALLAIIAATDLDEPRTGYRSAELEYYRDTTNASIVDQLVTSPDYGIYALALTLLRFCQLTPASHPLKKEIVSIIAGLKGTLRRLIQFHKAIDPQAIKRYTGFIGNDACAAPWGLPDNAAFECIDFVLPYDYVAELWKLFLKFYQALKIILEKARKAFQSALRTRKDHQPHIALFITFLYLFRHLQDDLNGLTEKHLLFYYHDVLRLARKRLTPDKVYLLLDIATNLTRYRLLQGTEFKAGIDKAGSPMTYELMNELVISNVSLEEKQNLYLEEKTTQQGKTVTAIALPAADKRDGIAEEWPDGTKVWQGLSGMQVFNRQYYKFKQLVRMVGQEREKSREKGGQPIPSPIRAEINKYEAFLGKLRAFSGFSINSTELWLNMGFGRIISIEFVFDVAAGANQPGDNLLDLYDVEIITEKGPVPLTPYPIEILPGGGTGILPQDAAQVIEVLGGGGHVAFVAQPPDPTFQAYNRIIRVQGTQQYFVLLTQLFPSILPIDDDTPPFIRFKSKDHFDHGLPEIDSVKLRTSVNGPVLANPADTSLTLLRVRPDGIQEDVQLVIDADQGNKNIVFIKYPELFFKWPDTMKIDATSSGLNQKNFFFWYDNTKQPVPAAGGQIPLSNTKETPGILAAPAVFNAPPLNTQVNGWIELDFTVQTAAAGAPPILPFILSVKDLTLNYQTLTVTIPVQSGRLSQYHYISQFTSLGEWIPEQGSSQGIRPNPVIHQPELQPLLGAALFESSASATPVMENKGAAQVSQDKNYGNLFLGFDKLVPGQTLSLLFKMAEGTGNPDHYAPDIVWSYLKDNGWITIPPQFILNDTTLGLQQTGIILFQTPADINNGNTWIKGKDGRTDLYWLRASAVEIPDDSVYIDALPLLKDIFVNAGEAVFEDHNNTEDHLEAGLPAGTIAAMRYRDVNVKSVTQPYVSFDGRDSETTDTNGFVRRVHERLRHKNRAVTIWDYERLVLQAFPKVDVVKCLTHTRRIYTARPGEVTLAVIPDPTKMTGTMKYYPAFDAGDLTTIKDFLLARSSYFVSNYGGPEFCCCEEGCQCQPGDRLSVINARFEPIRFKVCVRFYQGKDPVYYKKQLNEDIKTFLCPWATGNKPLLFGTRISLTALLQFLEELDYVDVILGLQVKHFPVREVSDEFEGAVAWDSPAEIVPYTAASVLTTYLDRLNEDNPNVVDHVINIASGSDKCNCGGCVEDETAAPPSDPNQQQIEALRHLLIDIWSHQQDTNQVIKAFEAQLKNQGGIVEYHIDKIKFANRIRQLKVSLSFTAGGAFSIFFVNNPNMN